MGGAVYGIIYFSDYERWCSRHNNGFPPEGCEGYEYQFVGIPDLILIESPAPESKIISPLEIKGEARGTWYFEASFPIILTDWDGKIIAQGHATAQDSWMTEDFVPFMATLNFENPSWEADFSKRGSLIFKKDNPSGLPEFNNAYEMTVWFE